MNNIQKLHDQTEVFRIYEDEARLECSDLAKLTDDADVKTVLLTIEQDEARHVEICDEIIEILST